MKYDTYKQDKILRDNVLDKYYSYLFNKRKLVLIFLIVLI